MYVFYFCYERGDAEVWHWPHPISHDPDPDLACNDCVWLIPGTHLENK